MLGPLAVALRTADEAEAEAVWEALTQYIQNTDEAVDLMDPGPERDKVAKQLAAAEAINARMEAMFVRFHGG